MKSLLTLNRYFFRYKWRLLLGVVFIVLTNLFGVFAPQVVREAFDLIGNAVTTLQDGSEQKLQTPHLLEQWLGYVGMDVGERVVAATDQASTKEVVLWLAVLLAVLYIAFALIKGFFLFLTRQTIIIMSRLIEYDLKNNVYQHYQALDRAFYKRNSTGDLMNRISEDVNKVRMYLGPAIMYTINLVVLFVMAITFMLRVNVELTLYALAPLPILSITIYYVSDVINRKSMNVQRQQSRLSTMAQETFSGIRVLKAYCKEDMVAGKFRENGAIYREMALSLAKTQSLFMPAILLLIGLSTILTIYVGGMKVINGEDGITVGNIAEFVIYVNMLTWPFASVGWVTSLVQQAAASMERINEFMLTAPEIADDGTHSDPIKGRIKFKDVSFRYPDTGILALNKVNFEIPAGGTLAIVGHTGSGKSTIADLMTRQFDATDGTVLIDGEPIQNVPLELLHNSVGLVPQDVFLFSDTISNNIGFSLDTPSDPKAQQRRIIQAAKDAQVHDNIVDFNKGYETLLGERGITLSGGQKQRVSIARAIVREPRILIFDDPLSAVDTATEEAILTNLQRIMKGRTTVIISHRISAVQAADHIIVLENGSIVEEGTHGALLKAGGHYAALYEQQLLEEARERN